MSGVAIIIPAYNEESRIASVILAAKESTLATEIIVVSDGSSDRTAEVARKHQVKVLDLAVNVGKSGAMCAGVDATNADIVCFVDADLQGLTGAHIDSIIRPVQHRLCEMCLGIFRGGRFWSQTGQLIFPYISGQRAMPRSLFLRIPNLRELRFGVEIAITNYVKRTKVKVRRVVLHDVSNCYKEEKFGIVQGIKMRRKMYGEMYRAHARDRRRAHLRTYKQSGLLDLKESEIQKAFQRFSAKNKSGKRPRGVK
jgi:polyisoprenyl-phosphate glycosyltransferase